MNKTSSSHPPAVRYYPRTPRSSLDVKIVSTGRFVPERVETAADLAPRLGVTAKWIESRTGVIRRHITDGGMAEMAAGAAKQALGDGPPPDLIINASGVPHQIVPDGSVFIQEALGLSGIPSFSVHATCLSFPVALHNAAGLIQAGAYERILIVSSEKPSRGRNFKEPESAALFGDGAGAVVVERTPEGESSAVLGFQMTTFPKAASFTELRGGGTRLHPQDPETRPEDNLFHMEGPEVYKIAVRRAPAVFRQLFTKCGVSFADIKCVVPHQASGPSVEIFTRFGFAREQIVSRVHEEGNCVAASIPMALAYAQQQGTVKRGDLVVLAGSGAGLSLLAMLIRW